MLLIVLGTIGNIGSYEVLLVAVFAAVITWALSRYYDKRRA